MKPDQVLNVIPQLKPTIGTWRSGGLRTGAFTPTHGFREVKIWRWRRHIFPKVPWLTVRLGTQSWRCMWAIDNMASAKHFDPYGFSALKITSWTDESRQLTLYMYYRLRESLVFPLFPRYFWNTDVHRDCKMVNYGVHCGTRRCNYVHVVMCVYTYDICIRTSLPLPRASGSYQATLPIITFRPFMSLHRRAYSFTKH